MVQSVATPLQLTAGVGLYNNTGIVANTQVANNISAYNSNPLIANLLIALSTASTANITANTLSAITSIGATPGANYCPAIGDSFSSNVTGYGNLSIGNSGFVATIPTGSAVNVYIGNGDLSKFVQAFNTVSGYVSVTNDIIQSVVNANTTDFLGPAFSNNDNLITGDLTQITYALVDFGRDLQDLGAAFALDNLDLFGTPAGLLQQIANEGNIINGSTPAVQEALLDAGLTNEDIADLVNDNRQSLFNPNGLTENEFNRLQLVAYPALCSITGADLQDVLTILGVTTANINSLCELLNPVKIFPRSYPSLTLPTPNGPVLIYATDTSVNSNLAPILNSGALSPVGCDELSKFLPPDQAAASRALQIAFQQVKGIANTTIQQLAEILT